ncbi:DNA-binding response regulator, OmpR family, contains REC and winged-helix (wHTH) domain [Desulfotomaculum arcticum]|uniref:Stage 0 sporulation protein A homolog n=1 Tax=Desulfotruncus arcticus DSM 17038 TaxID=1121424 RepID=A0A1I2V5E0_9FIRM|nr:DNA-binding response regulator, OmpR family, contains REC and winged-helix (wHTH) domain [Desulfotomaculum arcticum] [Desulfotruncus arcticus DSM 17038]
MNLKNKTTADRGLCRSEDYSEGIKILIVDDEERIREIIREYSSLEGYIIDEASDGAEALELFNRHQYALVILDVMMPGMDGWSVCREIRKISQVPVIMLTARGEEYDKLFGFELGVDDYIVKPFSPKELLARMKAIIRRSSAAGEDNQNKDRISFAGLVVEYNSRNVYVDGNIVNLTPKEYELLSFFTQNPNRVFSREQLLNSVWGYDFTGDNRTVDTHVKMLRESLADYRKFIVTVWGIGYKFEARGKK